MASLPGQDAIALMRSTASLHYLFTPTLALPLEGEGTLEIECLAMALVGSLHRTRKFGWQLSGR